MGEACDCLSETAIAGAPKADAPALTRLSCHGADPGFRRELVRCWEPLADITEFREYLCSTQAPGAGKRHNNLAVRQIRNYLLDPLRQLRDLFDEGVDQGNQSTDQRAFGCHFGVAGMPLRRRVKMSQHLGRTPPTRVALPFQEGRQACLIQAAGAGRGGEAPKECESDRAVESGEQRSGASPETIKQRP
jgi:hypothetical protein